MNMTFRRCALTGYDLQPENLKPITGTFVEYETQVVGHVKITFSAYNDLLEGDFEHDLIAGICKERTLNNEEPILIDGDFIRGGYKKLNPPTEFEEKCSHFLKYLYRNGGRENKVQEFYANNHFTLAFATAEEFNRIMDQLEQDYYITIGNSRRMAYNNVLYTGVKLTNIGKDAAKKELPKIPMFGLVSQEITTGDTEVDKKINHARELFFDEPQTMDKMRSACETLSYVLEPLRGDLSSAFTSGDVSDFFKLVNTFDIRHNKESTKDLKHPEQLEWVFYTLLNSINTYTKLKNKRV